MKPWENDALAPNGRAIKDNFADWFGASKVVERNGQPMRLFHGTRHFDGDIFGSGESMEDAIFFSDSASEAAWYSTGGSGEYDLDGETVIPVFLRIENPYVINLDGELDYASGRIPFALEHAKELGHDGLIVMNCWNGNPDSGEEGIANETQYVVFDASQVKSAIGNVGLYLKTSCELTDIKSLRKLELAQKAKSFMSKDLFLWVSP